KLFMDRSKLASAQEALKFVKEGLKIGLGSGSTAEIFIELLGKKNLQEDLGLKCIATSVASERQAKKVGLKLAGFEEVQKLDIAFDGADQVDSKLCLIKGLGGALVREKIVDYRARKFVVMVGENKLVERLSGVVPVEAIPMAEHAVRRELLDMGASRAEARMEGKKKFLSDNSNIIIHAEFGKISNPAKLEDKIKAIPGVVDSGIFAKKKPVICLGSPSGEARVLG
ncbi:MAG: ribose-5-phosphate isomerase RpiA, partial [Candidatus Anstonellaceae archaeon]